MKNREAGPFWTSSWGSGQNPPVQRAELGSLFRHGVGKRRMEQKGSHDLGSIPGKEGLLRSGKEVPGALGAGGRGVGWPLPKHLH